MARIPEDKIEWIKKNVPIERLCRRYRKEPVALHGRL
jgi:hypothetical protein